MKKELEKIIIIIYMGVNLITILLFFLVFILAKEVFSYDSEKFAVLCITSFVLLFYIIFKDILSNLARSKSITLKEEYTDLLLLNETYLEQIAIYYIYNKRLKNVISQLSSWTKINQNLSLVTANMNRTYFIYHLIKDQINIIIKEQQSITQYLTVYLIKNSFINLRLLFSKNIQNYILKINNLRFYFNKIAQTFKPKSIFYIILNKLSINKQFTLNLKWYNYNTYLYCKEILVYKVK